MELHNAQAAAAYFAQHNPESGRLDRIDLHGLYVDEALARVDQHILACRRAGVTETAIITGRGSHSRDGQAILRPRVETHLRQHDLDILLDESNAGRIKVDGIRIIDPPTTRRPVTTRPTSHTQPIPPTPPRPVAGKTYQPTVPRYDPPPSLPPPSPSRPGQSTPFFAPVFGKLMRLGIKALAVSAFLACFRRLTGIG